MDAACLAVDLSQQHNKMESESSTKRERERERDDNYLQQLI